MPMGAKIDKGKGFEGRLMANQQELRGVLNDLLKSDCGLSDWEMDFIESLNHWEGNFTDLQAAALEKTWNKHCLHINN